MTDPGDDRTDNGGEDAVSQLRDLPDRYRKVLGGHGRQEPPGAEEPPSEAVEEAAQVRDVLDAAARQVERLLEDSKPLEVEAESQLPRRGHYRIDPDVVLDVLDSNAERLAHLVEGLPEEAADRAPEVREALQSIAAQLVDEAVSESERRLRDAERSDDNPDG